MKSIYYGLWFCLFAKLASYIHLIADHRESFQFKIWAFMDNYYFIDLALTLLLLIIFAIPHTRSYQKIMSYVLLVPIASTSVTFYLLPLGFLEASNSYSKINFFVLIFIIGSILFVSNILLSILNDLNKISKNLYKHIHSTIMLSVSIIFLGLFVYSFTFTDDFRNIFMFSALAFIIQFIASLGINTLTTTILTKSSKVDIKEVTFETPKDTSDPLITGGKYDTNFRTSPLITFILRPFQLLLYTFLQIFIFTGVMSIIEDDAKYIALSIILILITIFLSYLLIRWINYHGAGYGSILFINMSAAALISLVILQFFYPSVSISLLVKIGTGSSIVIAILLHSLKFPSCLGTFQRLKQKKNTREE